MLIFIGLILASCDRRLWGRRLMLLWLGGLILVGVLMWGGILGMSYVETDLWNGLPLTLILAVVGMAFAFPLAILLALGRRSQLPAVRAICVAYIELIRGVPLITVLFMASVMLPLFLPTGMTIDKLLRAQVAFILFAAAYIAEVVRGGLQAIPKGQIEAADALGLGYWQRTRLIVLPQALALVIPPLVNTFIGTFKDTTLVIVIGLFDLLGTTNAALTDANWRGFFAEAYVFVAAIYFTFCFFMSRYSQMLEREFNKRPAALVAEGGMTDAAGELRAGKPIIELRHVDKWYGEFHVLRDINLEVGKGERIVICGPSGSGKSTMIRCINRLEEHQRGQIIVDGIELTDDLKHIDAIRREVGMVFQQFNLFPHLTVLENCTLAPIWVRKMPQQGGRGDRLHVSRAGAHSRAGGQISGPAVGRPAAARRDRARAVHEARRSCCSTSRPRRSTRRWSRRCSTPWSSWRRTA